jgi:hypothetical protein
MSWQDAAFWDMHVQPSILGSREKRADRYWSWNVLRQIFPLSQRVRNRRCLALTTFVANRAGDAIPAAMHLFIERYPHLDVRESMPAILVWFISAASDDALLALDVAVPPSLGRICIDTAIVASMNLQTEGRIGLHCARAGGEELMDFYTRICQLHCVPIRARLPVGERNDGRYFYTDEALAESLAQNFDPLRESQLL